MTLGSTITRTATIALAAAALIAPTASAQPLDVGPVTAETQDLRSPDTIDAAMLPMIVQGERAGDAGYQQWADNEPDAEVARLLRLNGREETLHGERVTEAMAILGALGAA